MAAILLHKTDSMALINFMNICATTDIIIIITIAVTIVDIDHIVASIQIDQTIMDIGLTVISITYTIIIIVNIHVDMAVVIVRRYHRIAALLHRHNLRATELQWGQRGWMG